MFFNLQYSTDIYINSLGNITLSETTFKASLFYSFTQKLHGIIKDY